MVEIIQDVLLANDYTTNSMVVAAEILETVLQAGMVPPDVLLPVPHPAIEGVVIMQKNKQWESEVEDND